MKKLYLKLKNSNTLYNTDYFKNGYCENYFYNNKEYIVTFINNELKEIYCY